MKFIRRVHMYTGLFMAPWVLMYGVSGFILNHGHFFNGSKETPLTPAALDQTAIGRIPAPEVLAQQVFTALNAQTDSGGPWTMSAEDHPHYTGNFFAELQGGGAPLSFVDADLNRHKATLTLFPPNPEGPRPPSDLKRLKGLGKPPLDKDLKAQILADTLALAHPGQKMPPNTQLIVPQLAFSATAGGKVWRISYNLENDRLNATVAKPRALPWWNFITNLHTSGGYPDEIQPRFFWGMVADCMAFLLCLWALTGVAMWFQMKYLRLWGAAAVLLAILAAWWLGSAMYHQFTGG